MITPEAARTELKKFENKEWVQARVDSLTRLPETLRPTARTMLGQDRHMIHNAYALAQLGQELLEAFAGMTDAARPQFFEALFPGLAQTIERGWQLFERLPYQIDSDRKPFRAAKHPETLLGRRIAWVTNLLSAIGPYQQNVTWLATWAAHLSYYMTADALGVLFAAAIDAGDTEGNEVFDILCASGRGEHPIGAMGRHITRALLTASRPDGWEFVEKLLLAAQREEGLRQTILESVDEAHPEAFRRMLRFILEHNLVRFSAIVRAFDVWLGYRWDAVSTGVVTATLKKLLQYLENPDARRAALRGKDAEAAYLALWTQAFDDAPATVTSAAELLKHPKVEHRFVAAHLLDQLGLVAAQQALLVALEDSDLRVTTCAVITYQGTVDDRIKDLDLFERLERLIPRYPVKPTELKPIVWPWMKLTAGTVADVLPGNLGKRPPTRLIPHLSRMDTTYRAQVVQLLAEQKVWDTATRDTLFALVSDASRQVREAALAHLAKCTLTSAEAVGMEQLLERKSSDFRRGILTLLARQSDPDALASAERLRTSKGRPLRLAGLELLRILVEEKRSVPTARARAEQHRAEHPTLNDAERQQLDATLAAGDDVPQLDNVLGLIRHEERTWPQPPAPRGVRFHSPSARRILATLEELLKARASETVSFKKATGEMHQCLLSDIQYGFDPPQTLPPADSPTAAASIREYLPLAEVWESWWRQRGPEFRDDDGMELLRAVAFFNYVFSPYGGPGDMVKAFPEASKTLFGEIPRNVEGRRWQLRSVLEWLLRLHPSQNAVAFTLDAAETALALVPSTLLEFTPEEAEVLHKSDQELEDLLDYDPQKILRKFTTLESKGRWRVDDSPFMIWLSVAKNLLQHTPQLWTSELHARHWILLRWVDEPRRPRESGGNEDAPPRLCCFPRERPELIHLSRARQAGAATDADVMEQLLGLRGGSGYWANRFNDLEETTRRKLPPALAAFPFLASLADRCRRRILELELNRGTQPTAATWAASCLSSVWGIDNLVAILRPLGQGQFVRGYVSTGDSQSCEAVFSHLTRCCFPNPDETASDFKTKILASNIPEQRLVELAVYAPQWAAFVEHTIGWPGLTEGVWWIHAHTKGTDWTVDKEIRDLWEAEMSGRTALTSTDLLEGAVDLAWFLRVQDALGEKRWSNLDEAAKFASTGAGHARARLFADAMLGRVTKKELVQRIEKKRYQDAVRALGLLPLAKGKALESDLLARYKVIQEFRRGSKQFGSQRQASEKRAAHIGQQNLARTACYPDPIRLEWAMEAKAVEDLDHGPIEVTVDGVKVSLGIDLWGEIEWNISRDGKPLSDIPAKLKKHPKIAPLRERKAELKRQSSRIRRSLEQFMLRGDEFTGTELRELMDHPLLRPMLANLVLVGDGIAGYPTHGGKALEDHRGQKEGVKAGEKLRVAHPHDLLPAASWHRWQKDCFAHERIQPFKQVFREYYPLTETEKKEGIQTRRYAGHQVQPRQALALLGNRGWVHHPEEGVRKVFHEAGLVAWLHFQEGFFTPAEIEGLTLESVYFTQRQDDAPLKLAALPPRLFSETMRDLDLVVSVAHRGGVDPEASASTIEMRASLVQETCRLLKLANVRLQDRHVLIKGVLGEYSIHLGSAITRKMPGETLFIVPVHSQHRGRLFLPFTDDDPKTAEVMSKVLLLARDQEIKDPNILDQIR